MVEGQREGPGPPRQIFADRLELGAEGVGAAPRIGQPSSHGEIGHADHPTPRVPARRAERPQLFQGDRALLQPGLLRELPVCRRLQVLVGQHEPSRQRELPLIGGYAAPHREHAQFTTTNGQHHEVDRNRTLRQRRRSLGLRHAASLIV